MNAVLRAGAVSAAALAASGATAQELPAAPPSARSFNLAVDETWDDNVRFAPDGGHDSLTRIGGGLDWQRNGRRGGWSVAGQGFALRHARSGDLDQLFYSGRLSGSHAVSRRMTLRLEEAISTGYASDQTALTELAVLPPRTRTRTNDVRAALVRNLSPRTTADVSVRHTRVAFESALLEGGDRVAGQMQVAHQLSRNSRLSGGAEQEWDGGGFQASWVSRLRGGWSGRVSGWLNVDLTVAVVRWQTGDEADVEPVAAGGFSLEGARTSVGVRYERSVGAAFGTGGLQSTDRLSGFTTWRFADRWSAGANVDYNRGRGSSAALLFDEARSYRANLAYHVTPAFALGAVYQFRRREAGGPDGEIESSTLTLSAGYTHRWR